MTNSLTQRIHHQWRRVVLLARSQSPATALRIVVTRLVGVQVYYYMWKDLATPDPPLRTAIPLEIQPTRDRLTPEWGGRQVLLTARGEYGVAEFERRLAEGAILFSAYSGGEFVGFGWLMIPPLSLVKAKVCPDEAYAVDTYVSPEQRGKGIMGAIMQAEIDYLRANVPAVTKAVHHVAVWNKASLSGDRKAGYRVAAYDLSIALMGHHSYVRIPQRLAMLFWKEWG